MAENPTAGVVQEEEEDNLEYDSDGNPIAPSKKIIDPLPPIDHSEIDYPPFEKNFYNEHEEITNLTPQQLIDLRHKLNLRVRTITQESLHQCLYKFRITAHPDSKPRFIY